MTVSSLAGNGTAGAAADSREYPELKKLIIWVLATLVPLTAIALYAGVAARSLAVVAIAVDCGASLILHGFNLITIGIILRQNIFTFPYGTGKLENFSGFLFASIMIPMSLIIINSAINRYLHPPTSIDLALAQAPLFYSIIRSALLFIWTSRMCRRFPDKSPMTHSYHVNFKLMLIRNTAILAGLLFGFWMFSTGHLGFAIAIDLLIAVSIALYMAYSAICILVRNFRSLIDMPLPEADQCRILNALVADFDAYEGIGNIYSQLSGNTRFIQIELYFGNATTVGEIEQLRRRIEERLRGQFSRLVFHLIPLIRSRTGFFDSKKD